MFFFNNICTYGILAWGGTYQNVINPLENIGNIILKLAIKTANDKLVLKYKQVNVYERILYHHSEIKSEYYLSDNITRNENFQIKKIANGLCSRVAT